MTRLWGGRFEGEPAPEMIAFTRSAHFDVRLVDDDCAILGAHAAVALRRSGILSVDEGRQVARALADISAEIRAGKVPVLDSDEDVHTTVERSLMQRLPHIAPRVRAGLSRNDRVVAALRRWLLREGADVTRLLLDLVESLAERAEPEAGTVMPGYTHLQRAQPVTLGHHLLAHAAALLRDAGRLQDALERAAESPLGAGALAGSSLELRPEATAMPLGFDRSMANSLDAVSARDFVVEFLAAAAILGVHLSRLGEEIVLWTSEEFGFATLDDAWATGSSLMPHKKNPDVAELARGKAGRLIGNLTGLLVALKGLPLAYNRDLQEDKEPLFDTIDTLRSMLPSLTGVVRTIMFHTEAMGRAAAGGALLATDLAEHMAREGTPFSEAHETVGGLVARAAREGRDLADVAADAAPGLETTPEASVERKGAPGPSRESVEAQLRTVREEVARYRDLLAE